MTKHRALEGTNLELSFQIPTGQTFFDSETDIEFTFLGFFEREIIVILLVQLISQQCREFLFPA